MDRLRFNVYAGTLGSPLAAAGLTLNSVQLTALPEIIAGQAYMPITIDPFGNPEVVWVTAHDVGAASATIQRAAEPVGPAKAQVARDHAEDAPWVHAPTVYDVDKIATVVNTDTEGASTIYVGTTEPESPGPGDVWLTPSSSDDPRFVTLPARHVTATAYTLVPADAGKVIEIDTLDAATVTVPPESVGPVGPWPLGAIIEVHRLGPGTVTITAADGVTMDSVRDLVNIEEQHASVVLRHRGGDVWSLDGRLA